MIPIEDVFLTGLCATEQLKLNLTHNDVSDVTSVHLIDMVLFLIFNIPIYLKVTTVVITLIRPMFRKSLFWTQRTVSRLSS